MPMKNYLLAVALLVTLPHTASGDEATRRALCRLSFGNTVRQRVAFVSTQVWLCHHRRLLGRIPASIDCSDMSTWDGAAYTDGVEALARGLQRTLAQSEACTVPTTSEVGYTSCPAPCAGLPTTTFPELGLCMECLTQASALTALQDTLGMPPVGAGRAPHACQQIIARSMIIYLNKRMKMQHDCQVLKEVQKPGFVGVDCGDIHQPTHPYITRAQRALEKITRNITRRCAPVMLASELDTCGTDAASEAACVVDAANQWTNTLMTALYPPY